MASQVFKDPYLFDFLGTDAPRREAELERENELLRLEIAYLKKLRAFRENPNVFHEKHKQKWHSNSKKKDID